MHSEVNRFLSIVMLFLCVGCVLIGVFYYVFTEMLCYVHVESNGFLRDCTVGAYFQVVCGTLVDILLSVFGRERLSVMS